eukprot:jgi/Mesvir1/12053/Mv00339-RA.1
MGQAARSVSLADKAVGAAKSVGGTVLDAGIMFGTFAGLDKVFGGGRKTMADPDETGGAREIHNGLPHPGEGSGGGGIASGGWPGVVLLFLVVIVLLAWIF